VAFFVLARTGTMGRFAAVTLLLMGLTACGEPAHDESAATPPSASTQEAFTSAGATLVGLAFDGTLSTSTIEPSALDQAIRAQLMFTVGPLNGESSVGRLDRADYKIETLQYPSPPVSSYTIGYHVTMPVAWGGGGNPASYALTLPRAVDQAAQASFASKYRGQCTDPEGGEVDPGSMFLFFRPGQAGCTLDPADVVTSTATVTAAPPTPPGKYPEYHRIWEDGELDMVAVFGREFDDGRSGDEGAEAYQDFLAAARAYLGKPRESSDPTGPQPNARLESTLPAGWRIRLDLVNVGPDLSATPSFDAWYEARTPDADVIVYNGHAGLGSNVETLVQKGTFRPQKYLVDVINGCDTFAYVDDTLAKRRAALNPDDASGTRYMDTLTNVLGGYFHSEAPTSKLLLDAMVSATQGTPKLYRDIFSAVDPSQIMLVTGDEDNEFAPGMMPAPPATQPAGATDVKATAGKVPDVPAGTVDTLRSSSSHHACGIARAGRRDRDPASWMAWVLAGVVASAWAARRRSG
jgi:hypothetical protein